MRKCVRSPSFPEWSKPARTKRAIDPYRPYLQERWQQGCHATSLLWQELQERGFSGSWMMVYRWVQLQGDEKPEALAQPQRQATPPAQKMAPRHLAWLFLRASSQLEKQEKRTLSLIRKARHIEIAYGLAQQCVTLLKEHNAQPLETWLWDCQMSGISDLVTFAASDWRKKVLLYTRHSPFLTVMGLSREKSTS